MGSARPGWAGWVAPVVIAAVGEDLRLELRADLADGSEELTWLVDPQLEPL